MEVKQPSKLDIFFRGPWNDFVYKLRFPIIAIFIIWGIIASVYAGQIGPLSSEEEFLPSDHEIQMALNIIQDKFSGGGNDALNVYLFWGISDLNKEGGSHWDAEFIGEAIMDDNFDLSPVDA